VTRWLVALSILLASVPAHAERAIGYIQGRKIKITVVDVDGVTVEERTAKAFAAMAEAAAGDGIELELTSGFRTNERQAELYDEYLHASGALAAKPGYSNHQSGHALDINVWNWTVFEWLDEHAAKYGFKRTVPSEPWHWEFRGLRTARRAKPSRPATR
jgi:LAS superfamily LD-carboxypeptidase LdcB